MKWHTVAEAAPLLCLSSEMVYRLCANGRLAHRRIGLTKGRGKIQISEDAITAYLKSCEVSAQPEDSPKKSPAKPKQRILSGRPDGKPVRDIWFK